MQKQLFKKSFLFLVPLSFCQIPFDFRQNGAPQIYSKMVAWLAKLYRKGGTPDFQMYAISQSFPRGPKKQKNETRPTGNFRSILGGFFKHLSLNPKFSHDFQTIFQLGTISSASENCEIVASKRKFGVRGGFPDFLELLQIVKIRRFRKDFFKNRCLDLQNFTKVGFCCFLSWAEKGEIFFKS